MTKKEIIIILSLIITGAILRIWGLDQYPAGFHGDEAITGLEARRILEQGSIGLWSPGALGQVSLSFYWSSLIFKLFGDSIFTARLSFALLNILSIPFFYLIARLIFNQKVAIISTLLIITGAVPLTFARRADLIAVNYAFFIALYFLIRSFHEDKIIYFILAGLFTGLSNYIYAPYWITPIIFLMIIFYQTIILRKGFVRKYLTNIGFLILAYILVAFPICSFAINHPEDFFSRTRTISIFSSSHIPMYQQDSQNQKISILINNLKLTLSMFSFKSEGDLANTGFNAPVFDPVTSVFFLVGLIICLYQFRKSQNIFLLIPFFVFLFGSILTVDAPSFRRSQGSIYLGYIFVGFGAVTLYQFFVNQVPHLKKVILVAGILLIGGAIVYNLVFYFNKYAVSDKAKNIYAYPLIQIANFANTLPPQTHIYFYSGRWSYNYETLKYLLANKVGEDRSKEFGYYSLNRNIPSDIVYIFLPEYLNSFEEVKKIYPGGTAIQHLDNNQLIFASYFLE